MLGETLSLMAGCFPGNRSGILLGHFCLTPTWLVQDTKAVPVQSHPLPCWLWSFSLAQEHWEETPASAPGASQHWASQGFWTHPGPPQMWPVALRLDQLASGQPQNMQEPAGTGCGRPHSCSVPGKRGARGGVSPTQPVPPKAANWHHLFEPRWCLAAGVGVRQGGPPLTPGWGSVQAPPAGAPELVSAGSPAPALPRGPPAVTSAVGAALPCALGEPPDVMSPRRAPLMPPRCYPRSRDPS